MQKIAAIIILAGTIFMGCGPEEDLLADGLSAVLLEDNANIPIVVTSENGDIFAPYTGGTDTIKAAIWMSPGGKPLAVWNSSEFDYRPSIARWGTTLYLFKYWRGKSVMVVSIDINNNLEVHDIPHNYPSALNPSIRTTMNKTINGTAVLLKVAACVLAEAGVSGLPCDNDYLLAAELVNNYDEQALEASGAVFTEHSFISADKAADFLEAEQTTGLEAYNRLEMELVLAQGALSYYPFGEIFVVLAWDESLNHDLSVIDPSGEELSPAHQLTSGGGVYATDYAGYGPEVCWWLSGESLSGEYIVEATFAPQSQSANYMLYVKNMTESITIAGTGIPGSKMELYRFNQSGALPKTFSGKVIAGDRTLPKVRLDIDKQ